MGRVVSSIELFSSNIDKKHIAMRFAKAAENYDENALVQAKINQKLIELLAAKNINKVDDILEIGCGTGGLTRLLQQNLKITNWSLNDLNDYCHRISSILGKTKFNYFQGDAEELVFSKESYDLIIAGSSIQWFSDPQKFIQKSSKLLKANGWLIFSVFSEDNLKQIKSITGKGLNYPTKPQWQQWLSANFSQIEFIEDNIDLVFNSPKEILLHLKHTGVGATNNKPWTKTDLWLFKQKYQQFVRQNQYILSYSPLIISAKKDN